MGNKCLAISLPISKKRGRINILKSNKRIHNLLRYKCFNCDKNGLIEKKDDNFIWAECSYCNYSGYNNKLINTYHVSSLDLALTLYK